MKNERRYRSYLLRLRQSDDEQSAWHASLEDLSTKERWGFPSIAHLIAFLEALTNSELDTGNTSSDNSW